MNMARTGMTVKALAELFAMYAKGNPDAVVRFTSMELGGRWPNTPGRTAMGVFVSDAIALADSTLCGGGITLDVMLSRFDKESQE